MMSARAQESPALWSELWAVHAYAEATTVEHQMRLAQVAMPLDARRQATIRGIQDHLDAVRHATARRGRFTKRGLLERWRGTSVERAYQHLHAAKVFLVDLLSPEDIDALAPYVVARATTALKSGDPRRAEIEKLVQLPTCQAKRAGLSQAMRFTYETSDQQYVRLRSFRNILFASAMLIVVLMVALVLLVAWHPAAMPLCFKPPAPMTNTTPGSSAVTPPPATAPTLVYQQLQDTVSVCPSGTHQGPTRGDVVIVAGLGLLGGALAAAVAIRKTRGTSTPYNVPFALALLKVPTGSLTAVAGIILLAGEVVPGLSDLDSQPQILAYALVLGYAQQAATRFLDDRAQTLLNRVPSKDPEARQPEPVAPALHTTPGPAPSATDTATEEPVPPRSPGWLVQALRDAAQRLDDRRARRALLRPGRR